MKIAGICDRDTAVGLRLAGIQELCIPDNNAAHIFKELSQRNDVGVIFITETIADKISRELNDFRLRHDIPIVVEIPDKSGHKTDRRSYVSYLIKKAVGIDIERREK